MNKFFGKYGMGLMSFIFVLCAAALGVDSGFAMAVEVLPNEEGAQEKTPVRFCFCVLNCGDMDYN